jgi:hypothetical protein
MTMLKPLTQRQQEILRGDAGHSVEKREEYKLSLWRAGYDVPGLVGLAVRFGTAVARHVAAGCPKPPPEVIAERMAICKACPEWRDGKCGLCGCGLVAKTAWAREECPADPPRWPKYSPLVQAVDHKEQLPLVPDTISDVTASTPVAEQVPPGVAEDRGS